MPNLEKLEGEMLQGVICFSESVVFYSYTSALVLAPLPIITINVFASYSQQQLGGTSSPVFA